MNALIQSLIHETFRGDSGGDFADGDFAGAFGFAGGAAGGGGALGPLPPMDADSRVRIIGSHLFRSRQPAGVVMGAKVRLVVVPEPVRCGCWRRHFFFGRCPHGDS